LVGIYPAGNLVRLYSGEIAVVLEVHAPDPYRPRVRIVTDKEGRTLEHTRDVNLFEAPEGEPNAVKAPVDPADVGIDPLVYLQ
jgi:hypothetical protein